MATSDQLAPIAQGGFLHLNREGRWPGFHRDGLDLDAGGTLRLGALPAAPVPPALVSGGAPGAVDGPSGVAVGPDGSVYYSVPGEDRIYRVDACDGSAEPVPCTRPGGAPGSLRQPRGLWWAPRRRALLAADSGNGRIDVLEAGSLAVRELWSGAGPGGGPGFEAPWAVAGDGKGAVYVADHGRRAVQKLDLLGQPVPSFWLNAAGAVQEPTGVAATTGEAGTRVYVLDAARRAVVVLDGDGRPVRDAAGAPLTLGAGALLAPTGLAASGDAVYVGDNQRLRVLVLQAAGGGGVKAYSNSSRVMSGGTSPKLWIMYMTEVP